MIKKNINIYVRQQVNSRLINKTYQKNLPRYHPNVQNHSYLIIGTNTAYKLSHCKRCTYGKMGKFAENTNCNTDLFSDIMQAPTTQHKHK